MWQCINNTPLCCMDCLSQTSLACTAHRQTESLSGWVLSDFLPGCSLEKMIRHIELGFVKSFYFILSIHSVLVQQSSGWISTAIKIPCFQECISCPWKAGEQDALERERGSWDGVVSTRFCKALKMRMRNAPCLKQAAMLCGCQAAGGGHWGDHTA